MRKEMILPPAVVHELHFVWETSEVIDDPSVFQTENEEVIMKSKLDNYIP